MEDYPELIQKFQDRDMIHVIPEMKRRYGDFVRILSPRLDGNVGYLISNPDDIQYILEKNHDNYVKGSNYDNMREMLGEGLVTSEKPLWLRQRRLIGPHFKPDRLMRFMDVAIDEASNLESRLETYQSKDEEIDILREMKRVTLNIIGDTMFSTDMDSKAEKIADSMEVLRQAGVEADPGMSAEDTIEEFPEVEDARDQLESVVYGMIDRRREDPEAFDDLLATLMQARHDDTGEKMSDKQVRDEVMTILLAGHETTATALTWTWILLSKNPEIYRELHEKATETELDMDSPGGLLDSLSYTLAVLRESMRIYPPVPMIGRQAKDDDEVQGYTIPAGSQVLMSQFVMHRNPDIWDDPMEFRPSRFLGDNDRPDYSFFPFGGGERICIGNRFALMEGCIIIQRLVQNKRIELANPDEDIEVSAAVTMQPSDTVYGVVRDWD